MKKHRKYTNSTSPHIPNQQTLVMQNGILAQALVMQNKYIYWSYILENILYFNVVQCNANIVPIEVKSGTKGAMQSMFHFLSEKEYSYGIRCSMENFNTFQNIKIYPLYAVSRIGK